MVIHSNGLTVADYPPNWLTKILSVVADPTLTFLLLMVGVYGMIFEMANPGLVVPGVMGAISLVLALYGLSVLPVNAAGLGLMVLGLAFLIAEGFMPSFGILGAGVNDPA